MKQNSWDHDEDPYCLIPVNRYIDNGKTKITGFCSPVGKRISRLMVRIEYSDGSTTTRRYLAVLQQTNPELASKLIKRLNNATIN